MLGWLFGWIWLAPVWYFSNFQKHPVPIKGNGTKMIIPLLPRYVFNASPSLACPARPHPIYVGSPGPSQACLSACHPQTFLFSSCMFYTNTYFCTFIKHCLTSCPWYMEKALLGGAQQPWNTNLIWRACVASAREESHPFITIYFRPNIDTDTMGVQIPEGTPYLDNLYTFLRHLRPCTVLVKSCVMV